MKEHNCNIDKGDERDKEGPPSIENGGNGIGSAHDDRFAHFMNSITIEERAEILQRLLNAIQQCERIARDEFSSYNRQFQDKYPIGFRDGYDPTNDEALTLQSTGLALYGSLAVAIAAYVEDVLALLFRNRTIRMASKKASFQ
jgi:hypothetical protein